MKVEVIKGVWKLPSLETLGQRGCMPECRNPVKSLEGDSWYLSYFRISPVFEKRITSVEEEHRDVTAVTGVGIRKSWGLRICRVILGLGPGVLRAAGLGHLGFHSLVGPQLEHRKCQ